MKITNRMRSSRVVRLALLAGVMLPTAWVSADTIILKSGTGKYTAEGTITRIEGTDLIYSSAQTERESKKPLDSVLQIKATAEPKLTAAEQAYADGKWDDAVTNYQAALNSTSAEWVKTRAIVRLIDAAAQSKQFAPQVAAFVEMAKRDPATARKHKPETTGLKADQIKSVIGGVERAANNPNNKKETSDLMKEFLADLYLATGDTAAAQRAVGPAAPAPTAMSSSGNPGVPAAGSGASPEVVLSRARVALASKTWTSVISDIESNRAVFTDPAQQAEALYDLAEAKNAAAGDDPQKLQDAAIAYMRLVTHFDGKAAPAGSNVPTALYKVALIEERLKQPAEAMQIYLQLSTDQRLRGTPIAADAAKRLAALRAQASG